MELAYGRQIVYLGSLFVIYWHDLFGVSLIMKFLCRYLSFFEVPLIIMM